MIVTAWVTVALAGEGPSEAEIEQVTERSERLAAQPPPEVPPTEFDALVEEAIDALPAEFRNLLEDTPVVISHRAYGLPSRTVVPMEGIIAWRTAGTSTRHGPRLER